MGGPASRGREGQLETRLLHVKFGLASGQIRCWVGLGWVGLGLHRMRLNYFHDVSLRRRVLDS